MKLNHLGYDISSSIETDGMKDKNKMLTVIQQVKGEYNMYNIQTEADELGFSENIGGQYVPETLMPAIIELKQAYNKAKQDQSFQDELTYYLKEYVGRETSLTYAKSYSEALGGAQIYLKRDFEPYRRT